MFSQNRPNINRTPYSFPRSAYSTCRVWVVSLCLCVVCVCCCPEIFLYTLRSYSQRSFSLGQSDHLTILNAYNHFDSRSGNERFAFARDNFLGIRSLQTIAGERLYICTRSVYYIYYTCIYIYIHVCMYAYIYIHIYTI